VKACSYIASQAIKISWPDCDPHTAPQVAACVLLTCRPNVATEDVGRLFSQGSLEAMRSTKVQQHKLQAAKGSDRVT